MVGRVDKGPEPRRQVPQCLWWTWSGSGAAVTEHHTEGLKQQNCIMSRSGGQKSETTVWAGLVPSDAVRESLFRGSCFPSGGLSAIFDFFGP